MFIIYSKVCANQFRSVSVLRNMYLKKKTQLLEKRKCIETA